jgi:hypothetical protein
MPTIRHRGRLGAEEPAKLGEGLVRRRCATESTIEVELKAQQIEALGRNRRGQIEREELTLREEILWVVLGENRRALARLEGGRQKLQARDAFSRPRCAAEDVRPSRHDATELLVDGADS